MSNKVVIIGGDAAGMSAAAKVKRDCPEAEVIVFEQGEHISYSACGMPYWIGGVIDSDRKLIVMTPEVARRRRKIDVRIFCRVERIDPASHMVQVHDLKSGRYYAESYDYLVIATGARPAGPPIPGINSPGVLTLRTLSDGQHIYEYMAQNRIGHVTVIGGGYIGIEMAEAMRDRQIPVTLVEMMPHLMPNFDPEMVEDVATHLQSKGVDIHLNCRLEKLEFYAGRLHAHLVPEAQPAQADPAVIEPIASDMVIVATGVRPNAEIAGQAGLRLGHSGAIWVDRYMQTSDPHIYAAGDCVEHLHLVTGENAWIPLATSANKGGRIAGENIAGRLLGRPPVAFPGILGTAIVKAFDYTLAITGLTEHDAKAIEVCGEDGAYVGSAKIENDDRAGYWPGAEKISVKLVFDKRDGRILGGQLVGKAGVNKRIDIIATAISARMTLEQVALLDLSYAPPYSPTYDPIQICANVGQRDVGQRDVNISTQIDVE